MTIPRGIKNNNPGNLEDAGIPWRGMDHPSKDEPYLTFADPVMGMRALIIDLINANHEGGYGTLETLITHYAPPKENDTVAYIADVLQFMQTHDNSFTHMQHNTPLNLTNFHTCLLLARGIIKHENGINPDAPSGDWYTRDQYAAALTKCEHWGTVTPAMLRV